MAFELPQHLPRGGLPQDKSTKILSRVGETSLKELNSNLVASWVNELDDAIKETKDAVAKKVQQNLAEFERLFRSSVDVQTRLHEITSTVSDIEEKIESPTAGFIPKLVQTFTLYSSRERQALESGITHDALDQLLQLCLELQKVHSHMARGELSESTQICRNLDVLILKAPVSLQNAKIMSDIKKRYRMLRDRVQEQLSDAYDRCVSFSGERKLEIHQAAVVSSTSTRLSLPTILSSLSRDALTSKLASFRRDVLSNIVDPILLSSHTISVLESDTSNSFSVILSSESVSPVQSLRSFTHFIRSHFLLHLPEGNSDFVGSLYTSLGSSLLTKFLQPSIPSSLSAVPAYLNTLNDAMDYEAEYLESGTAGSKYKERLIRKWYDDIPVHYEKKRRETFLEKTRTVIGSPDDGATFRVEMIVHRTVSPPPLTASTKSATSATAQNHFSSKDNDESVMDQWGFDDDNNPDQRNDSGGTLPPVKGEEELDDSAMDDNWGWNDEEETEDLEAETTAAHPEESPAERAEGPEEPPAKSDQQGAESLKEEDDDGIDPWDDDPWAAPEDEPAEPVVESNPKPPVPPPISVPPPIKAATRLEKFSAKAKGHALSATSTPALSPAVSDAPRFQPQVSPSTPRKEEAKSPLQPLIKKEVPVKESYLVTVRTRRILEIAGEVLRESKELLQSHVFSNHRSETDKLGQLLLSTTSSIIDLYRALYPIVQAALLSRDSTQFMQWSNDCLFLSTELTNFKFPDENYKNEKWLEARDRTQTLGECCFEEAIAKTQGVVHSLLAEANGFANVSDQYEQCKDIMYRIIDEIEDTTQRWKKILSRSQYLVATGRIVDDALSRLMDEILSMEDIPQTDSEYLSEFCEMMEKLEGLFVYTSIEQSTVGVHVPIWFKFSYFSWLIKGSIADISYMFEQGHLVDYEIDELVRLLRALFAETPLRERTIQKVLQGHPDNQMQ